MFDFAAFGRHKALPREKWYGSDRLDDLPHVALARN